MSMYIVNNGEKQKVNISATDVQLLDIDGKFKSKNLEDAMKEVGGGTAENMNKIEGLVNKNISDIEQLSNPNLFINGDFQVWQRGTSFNCNINVTYTADRWVLSGDTLPIAKKTEKGITITTSNIGTWTNFCYKVEDDFFNRLMGKKLTLTFKTSSPTNDINLVWCNGRTDDDKEVYHVQDSHFSSETIDTFSVTFDVNQKTIKNEIGIQLKSDKVGRTVELLWAKLEIGGKATPFVPRSYGEELASCQRYFQNYVISGVSNETNCLSATSRFPVIMRVNPTISYIPKSSIHQHGKGEIGTVEDITEVSCLVDRVDFVITREGYFATGKAYNVQGTLLDAEIY